MSELISGDQTLPEIDLGDRELAEKIQRLKEKVGLTPRAAGLVTGDETQSPQGGGIIDPATIDWDDFELEHSVRHLYPKSKVMQTPNGPKFVAPIVDFQVETKTYKTAGEYLHEMVNGPEQWQVAAILPNGAGLIGFVLQRTLRVVLPDPKILETKTEVGDVTDDELATTEKAALDWAGRDNG